MATKKIKKMNSSRMSRVDAYQTGKRKSAPKPKTKRKK